MTGRVFGTGTPSRSVTVRAPAKVNLHLEVLRQRHDGYHDIETVFQAVSLFDQVEVSLLEVLPGGKPRIEMQVSPRGAAPRDASNLCWQAVETFCRHARCSGAFRIELRKTIPMAAGLGGGSSDAAAVLVACDHLFKTGLEIPELERLGARLGSDVPFFIRGGTALGRGRGTELSPLPTIRSGQFLIVKPEINLLSANVYRNLRMGLTVRSPKANIQGMKPLTARFPSKSWFGFNRLEEVVLPSQPTLQRLVLHLRESAPVVMLCGSGSAVVAVYTDRDVIPPIPDELQDSECAIYLVGPHATGVQIAEG